MAFGGENAESYYDEGITASMKGDVALALRHFQRAIELDPSMLTAKHQLGKCYLRLGDIRKGAALLQEVCTAQPKQVPARVDLGYALLDLNKVEKARAIFSDVAAFKPDNSRAQLGLAYCAFAEGSWDAAMTLAQTAVNVGGANFAALYLLGRAMRLAGRPDAAAEIFERADGLLEKSIETSPDQPEGYFLRGELHFAHEDFAKALENYRSAEDRAQPGKQYNAYNERFTRLDILAKRGLCLLRLGRREAARELGEQILASDPAHKLGQTLRES
jgi:tetratricopeptide (TPR) repeat protein